MSYFDPRSIPKCHDRMDKAKEALFKCRNARTYQAFTSAWADFLIQTGSILHALEAGANLSPQGRQWYGSVKRFGKSDSLISYMHQARNCEEHQTEPTTGNAIIPGIGLINQASGRLEPLEDVDAPFKPENAGKSIGIGFHDSGPFLREIEDIRFGQVFDPPVSHNGKALKSENPIEIAGTYLAYLSSIIEKAEEMA